MELDQFKEWFDECLEEYLEDTRSIYEKMKPYFPHAICAVSGAVFGFLMSLFIIL